MTQVAVLLEREGDSLTVATGLRKQLAGVPVEVLPWRESMPTLAQIFLLDEAFNYVMNGVVLAMVGLGILNTILMRVLERRYEFGLCTALGLRPRAACSNDHWRIVGAHGDQPRPGSGAGFECPLLFRHPGLDLRWVFRSDLPRDLVFDPIIYSRLSLGRIVSSVSIVFLTATVISFYPAFKAARTELPDALKVF